MFEFYLDITLYAPQFEHVRRIYTNGTYEKNDVCNSQDTSEASFGEPHLCVLS